MVKPRRPKITTPDELPAGADEAQRAAWWRQHVMQMTRADLAAAINYGADAVWSFEKCTRDRSTANKAWSRYRNACEALHRATFKDDARPFDWGVAP